jgi:hypothetical protein
MKKLIIFSYLYLLSLGSFGFEIFALGTSNTNCKGAGQAYTNTLNEIFIQEKINAQIINAGIDGDRPQFMMVRLDQGLKAFPNTKIVIFEPGPNEKNKAFNLEASEEILKYLQTIKMPTIYVSNTTIQTDEEAKEFAQRFSAYDYGNWSNEVPRDRDHRQYDQGGAGHMTATGCKLWATNMAPFIKRVIKEKGIQ